MSKVVHRSFLEDAIQYTGNNLIECEDFVFGNYDGQFQKKDDYYIVNTVEGDKELHEGDWIIFTTGGTPFVVDKNNFNKYWVAVY